jgi:ribulose-5-phosphate 4-epimerase/fuculose-1-phosphate aldolase
MMILRNHGTLAMGKTCADAFLRLYYLERSCTIQVRALAGGSKINPTHQGVAEKTAGTGTGAFEGMIGNLAWPGLLRTLDRKDPSYRN